MALSLLTGFPGFIGRRLAARLIESDPEERVLAVVEERMLDVARSAAAEIDDQRIELAAGDIGEPGLGLSAEVRERVVGEMRRAYHLAAIYDLAVPLEIAQRVNVDGTGNVLELCAAAESLERLAYVSTAYVAGLRRGVVYEHELVFGQEFKNHYESTKFQAEVWTRQYLDRVPMTILRPAIVVGDSRTGETQKFDGPYFILRTIAEADRRGRAVPQFGRADAPFNVVPVDYVVEAILATATDPAAERATLHLTDPEPHTAADLTAALSHEYCGRAPKGRIPPALVANSLRSKLVRDRFGGAPRESIVYLNHPVMFDARQALRILEPHGLRPPNFGDYVGAMVGFFREHEDDPALVPKAT